METSRKIKLVWVLIVLMVLSAIVPILAVGYSALSSIASERENRTEELLSRQAAQMQNYQGEVEYILARIAADRDVISYLEQMERDPDSSNPADINLVQVAIQRFDTLPGTHTVDLVTTRQLVYSTQRDGQAGKRYPPERISDVMGLSKDSNSAVVYLGKTDQDIPLIFGPTVASVYHLKYFQAETGETRSIGMIVLNYSFQESMTMVGGEPAPDLSWEIIPETGPTPYAPPPMKNDMAEALLDSKPLSEVTVVIDEKKQILADETGFLARIPDISVVLPVDESTTGSKIQKIGSSNYMVTYYRLDDPQMTLLNFATTGVFFQTSIPYGSSTFWVFMVCLGIMVIVASLISFAIINPVHRVTNAFELIQKGTFDWNQRIHPTWMREMNDMVSLLNGFLDNQMLQKKTETDLVASQQKYRSLFENSPIPMWEDNFNPVIQAIEEKKLTEATIDAYLQDHPADCVELISRVEVLDVNKATLKLYHARQIDLLRANQKAIFEAAEVDKIREQLVSIYKRQRRFEQIVTNSTINGKKLSILLQWTVHPGNVARMDRVVLTTMDITEQAKVIRLQTAILKISQAALTVNRIGELFEIIHETLGMLMPARNMYIALYDSKNELISFPYFVDEMDPIPPSRKMGNGWTELVIRTGEPVLINDEQVHPLNGSQNKVMGTRPFCWLGAPLIVQGSLTGVLVVQSYDPATKYTEEDKDLLTIAANQIAMAIYKKKTEERLVFSSSHDELTGLYNRAYFEEETRRLSDLPQEPIGVIMMDLDNLKYTNDQYGHSAGDQLIRSAATIIRGAFRMSDMIARIGGDEFVVLISNATMDVVQTAIDRIQFNLDRYNSLIQDKAHLIGISIGGSVTDSGVSLAQAIQAADEEMYRVKAERKASGSDFMR